MELKELTDKTFELFGIDNPDTFGSALLENINNTDKINAFCELVVANCRRLSFDVANCHGLSLVC